MKAEPWKFDPSPLYACEVTDWCDCAEIPGRHRHVLHWMAFDPIYGPESEAQIAYYRRQHGARFVQGWEGVRAADGEYIGRPLEFDRNFGGWHRERFRQAKLEDVAKVSEKAEIAALESGDTRNDQVGTTPSPSPPKVTATCAWCGAELPENRGGRKRRQGAEYCSNAHKQAAYRQRKEGAS